MFFPPATLHTIATNHPPHNKPHSSSLHKQIDSYIHAAEVTLDAALRDFANDLIITQSNDVTTTDNHTSISPSTDPSHISDHIDSYFASATLTLDAALRDFDHIVSQQSSPPQSIRNNNTTTPTTYTPDIDPHLQESFTSNPNWLNDLYPNNNDYLNDSIDTESTEHPPPTATAITPTHPPHTTILVTCPPKPSLPRQFDISTFATQNTHGLRRLPRDSDGKLLTTAPYDYTRYEHLINIMKTKNLDVYFVQETWLEDDAFDEVINSYHVFRHNGGKGNHNFRGVAIILSPRYYQGWKDAGSKPPLTTDATGEFAGRYISINVILKSYDKLGKQVRGKNGPKHLALTLASVYHPCTKAGSEDVYARFLDTLDTLLNKLPTNNEIIMGADVNANIGTLDKLQSSDFKSALGPHGFPKRNPKGESLLTVYLAHRLRVMNTFFGSKTNGPGHGTWTSNRPTTTGVPESHMLDLIVCSTTLHKRIKNCQTTNDGADSDHRAVRMQLNLTSLKYKKKVATLNSGDIDWRKICEEEEQRKLYNKYLLELTSRDMTYDAFCEAVVRAGRETAVSIECQCEGWYQASESILAPAIEEKNRLRHQLQDRHALSDTELADIQLKLKHINKRNRDLVDLAKARWYSGICTNIHNMRFNPRLAWENIRLLTGGETTHHKTNINMAMKLESGDLASNAKENMSVFSLHFHNVLNNHRPVDDTVLELIPQKPCLSAIDTPITFREVKRAINKLKKGKAPGLNGIPPEALKAMDDTSRRIIHKHVSDFFEGKMDHEEWRTSQCVPVPKKGDLSDPNKWRGIMLMDVCSKVFSSIMTARAFQLLDKHGTRFQFGGTPELGCRDGLFTLKALLNARQNHDLASYVGFVDLVKAYDTANHTLLLRILERYGAPPKFVAAVQTIYTDNKCILKIEKESVEIPQTVGVRQGDNMAPVLFLFLMTAFAETLETVWREQNIPILKVMTASNDNLINGKICSHTPNTYMSKKLTAYEILQCLYVDDGAFPFGSREDLKRGMNLIFHHFSRFGLEMHIGRGKTPSKTECVFFPPPQFFQHAQRDEAAATLIQRTYRRTHPTVRSYQLAEQPAPSSTCTTDFPIGCHVVVASSHKKHANKAGIVCKLTKKFVFFTPDTSPTEVIRILPKTLAAYNNDGRRIINSTDDDEDPDQGRTEREHTMYDKLKETQDFPVADGTVTFTRTFRYLGSLISYNLRDDEDITARLAAANASMGRLKEVWRNPHLDIYNKYLLFRAIPMNLLLWGAETWSLRKTHLDKLEVFLHRSIRRILRISITTVRDQHIRNDKVRRMFYSIPCVRNMIAARQMDFVGKMIRGPPDRPSRNMITACCDHKRRAGRPQTTGKNFMVENLCLLFQDVPNVQIDRHGSLRSWIHEASHEKYWCQLVERLLHPSTPLPDRPDEWGPLPSWQARRAAAGHPPPNRPSDNHDTSENEDSEPQAQTPPQSPPPRPHCSSPPPHQPPPTDTDETTYDPKRWLNDHDFCSLVGRSMFHSLTILGLGLGASEMEIKVHYRQLARKYHPDKNDHATTGLTMAEASNFFKLLNNANEYLKERQ